MADTPAPPSLARVEQLLTDMVDRRIAVIGDVMLDAYILGDVRRISPEAPVPVMSVQEQSYVLGGAGNVAKCLVALGAEVRLCGILGDDDDGRVLRQEAANLGIDASGLCAANDRPTIRKTRVVARHQQVIRLDQEQTHPLPSALESQLIETCKQAAEWAEAIIISDYAKAALTDKLCQAVIQSAGERVVVVDPKQLPWDRFADCTVIKPNLSEAAGYIGHAIHSTEEVAEAAASIGANLNASAVLVTRGADGMTLWTANDSSDPNKEQGVRQTHTLPATPLDVFDVTGAGDVVAAVLAQALAAKAPMFEASFLANTAAGVKVAKFGAATVSNHEILEALEENQRDSTRKIMSFQQVNEFAAQCRQQGRKVVFTNGCFDILHVGHVRYLEASRKLGDVLIVGINADASVRRLKGSGRPVQPEDDRAHILASQSCVDAVVIFEQDTPIELIETVQPDVLTKGEDYQRKEDIVGWDIVEKRGGQVHRIPLVAGRSTTNLIRKTSTDAPSA